jgi:hypothetical protein
MDSWRAVSASLGTFLIFKNIVVRTELVTQVNAITAQLHVD